MNGTFDILEVDSRLADILEEIALVRQDVGDRRFEALADSAESIPRWAGEALKQLLFEPEPSRWEEAEIPAQAEDADGDVVRWTSRAQVPVYAETPRQLLERWMPHATGLHDVLVDLAAEKLDGLAPSELADRLESYLSRLREGRDAIAAQVSATDEDLSRREGMAGL